MEWIRNIWRNHFLGFMAALSFSGLVLTTVLGNEIDTPFILFNVWAAAYYLKCEINKE